MRLLPSSPSARRWLATLWTVAILVACWLPKSAMPVREASLTHSRLPHVDKVVHFTMFAGFGALWTAALQRGRGRWVIAAGMLLAVVTEVGQNHPWVGRDGGIDDGLADFVGTVIGVIVAAIFRARYDFAESGPRGDRSST
jgi:VanZ family protein